MAENDDKAAKTVLEQAKKRLELCQEAEDKGRKLSAEDFRFYSGQQWPDDIKKARSKQGALAVCLTVNRCKPAVHQITNDQRQNRGAIRVSPVDSGADILTAEVFQGVIRHIEYDSDADVAYDTAHEHQVIGGFGFIRVNTEYEDEKSFRQCIKIDRFRNAFAVFLDPSSTKPDGSDAKYAFVLTKLAKDEYKAEYPKSKMASFCGAEDASTRFPDWLDSDGVVVAEYFYFEGEKDTLYLLQDGSTVLDSELPDEFDEALIVDKREVETPAVKWCKLNGAEILEETDWPGKYIPIVKVTGDELEVDGELITEGLIRQAKDPQRMINYWRSKQTEAIALAPKAPWVAAEGQLEGHPEWERSNIENFAVLQYKATDVKGTLVGQPQRNVAEPAIAAITVAGTQANQDFEDVTQLHEASYGERSNEKSGRAIVARQQQGQTGNFHFVDNLTRSRRHLGRILLDLIPKVYREKGRIMRILGEDGTPASITLGQKSKYGGEDRIFELGVGRYDVVVDTGPAFATRRKEGADAMATTFTAIPELFKVAGDLYFKAMDWPYAQEMAERAKMLLPPEARQDDKQQQIPPQVQQQMAKMAQVMEMMGKELDAKNKLIDTKELELASKERIEMAKLELQREELTARIAETQAKLDSQEAIALLQAEIEGIKAQLDINSAALAQETGEAAQQM